MRKLKKNIFYTVLLFCSSLNCSQIHTTDSEVEKKIQTNCSFSSCFYSCFTYKCCKKVRYNSVAVEKGDAKQDSIYNAGENHLNNSSTAKQDANYDAKLQISENHTQNSENYIQNENSLIENDVFRDHTEYKENIIINKNNISTLKPKTTDIEDIVIKNDYENHLAISILFAEDGLTSRKFFIKFVDEWNKKMRNNIYLNSIICKYKENAIDYLTGLKQEDPMPDIVLTDICMEGTSSGVELAQYIKTNFADYTGAIIAVTSDPENVKDYVGKLFNLARGKIDNLADLESILKNYVIDKN